MRLSALRSGEDPAGMNKPLTSHDLFPGRQMLTIRQVAEAIGVDCQHVTNLVESGDLTAVDLRTSKRVNCGKAPRKHKSFRQLLRVPASALDDLLARRRTV